MTDQEFAEAVQMLRSADPLTYDEGYHWLQGDNLRQHIVEILDLLRAERQPTMRAKFVELVGDADLVENIPLLVAELSHEHPQVRSWAYSGLCYSEHPVANKHALEFRRTHPDEEFL